MMNATQLSTNTTTPIPQQLDLQTENERLRAQVEELKRRLDDMQDRHDFFRHFAMLWLNEHTEKDWTDLDPDEYTALKKEMTAEAKEFMNW